MAPRHDRLRRLRQPIGGSEADHVFRFLLALIVAAAILFFLLEGPHQLSHMWRGETGVPTSCLSNLNQIKLGLEMYCADNDQRLPPRKQPVAVPLLPYLKNRQIFVCPSDPSRPPQPQGVLYTSYATNDLLLGLPLERVQGEPFAWDREPWHKRGRNVLTIGSKPKWVRERDWLKRR